MLSLNRYTSCPIMNTITTLQRRNLAMHGWQNQARNWIWPPVPAHGLDGAKTVSGERFFPDLALAKTFNRRFSGHQTDRGTLTATLANPQLIASYVQVAKVMHTKELIPLVHGQSSLWMVAQRAVGWLDCPKIRSCAYSCSRAEVIRLIDEDRERRAAHWLPFYNRISVFKTLDVGPQLRDRLLSVTIGLFHCEAKNAPLSYVLGGSYLRGPNSMPCQVPGNRSYMETEKCRKLARRMITDAMQLRGYELSQAQQLISRLEPLFDEAIQAPIGQLLVLGVPARKISQWAYHSETGGLPTGYSVNEVLEGIEQGALPKVGCQARLLLCDETFAPESGTEVINIMDRTEVEKYIQTEDTAIVRQVFERLYEDSNVEERLQQTKKPRDQDLLRLDHIAEKIDQIMHQFL